MAYRIINYNVKGGRGVSIREATSTESSPDETVPFYDLFVREGISSKRGIIHTRRLSPGDIEEVKRIEREQRAWNKIANALLSATSMKAFKTERKQFFKTTASERKFASWVKRKKYQRTEIQKGYKELMDLYHKTGKKTDVVFRIANNLYRKYIRRKVILESQDRVRKKRRAVIDFLTVDRFAITSEVLRRRVGRLQRRARITRNLLERNRLYNEIDNYLINNPDATPVNVVKNLNLDNRYNVKNRKGVVLRGKPNYDALRKKVSYRKAVFKESIKRGVSPDEQVKIREKRLTKAEESLVRRLGRFYIVYSYVVKNTALNEFHQFYGTEIAGTSVTDAASAAKYIEDVVKPRKIKEWESEVSKIMDTQGQSFPVEWAPMPESSFIVDRDSFRLHKVEKVARIPA